MKQLYIYKDWAFIRHVACLLQIIMSIEVLFINIMEIFCCNKDNIIIIHLSFCKFLIYLDKGSPSSNASCMDAKDPKQKLGISTYINIIPSSIYFHTLFHPKTNIMESCHKIDGTKTNTSSITNTPKV